jgi:Cu/Zn superoxide dismutase
MIVRAMLSYAFMFLKCTAPAWGSRDYMRHVGDLGNIKSGDDGVAKVELGDPVFGLTDCPRGIVRRTLIMHMGSRRIWE